jgi:hypothetical protein
MRSRSMQTRHWSVRRAIVQRWRRLIGVRATEPTESADVDPRQPLTRDPNDVSLLVRRMAALDLDSYELAIVEAALVHHLQRRCRSCEAWRRCLQDLAGDRADVTRHDCKDWMEYCPNASALSMLSELQSRTKIAPRYSFPYLG